MFKTPAKLLEFLFDDLAYINVKILLIAAF